MRTTIDAAGRVVIPKPMRERFALRGGDEIEIEDLEDRIEIRRPGRDVPLVEGPGGVLKFASGPGLGPEEVRDLIERQRR